MGLSDRRLQEHVVAEHGNSSKEVVRICQLSRDKVVSVLVLP